MVLLLFSPQLPVSAPQRTRVLTEGAMQWMYIWSPPSYSYSSSFSFAAVIYLTVPSIRFERAEQILLLRQPSTDQVGLFRNRLKSHTHTHTCSLSTTANKLHALHQTGLLRLSQGQAHHRPLHVGQFRPILWLPGCRRLVCGRPHILPHHRLVLFHSKSSAFSSSSTSFFFCSLPLLAVTLDRCSIDGQVTRWPPLDNDPIERDSTFGGQSLRTIRISFKSFSS